MPASEGSERRDTAKGPQQARGSQSKCQDLYLDSLSSHSVHQLSNPTPWTSTPSLTNSVCAPSSVFRLPSQTRRTYIGKVAVPRADRLAFLGALLDGRHLE